MNRKLNGARTFVFSPNISALVRVATLVAVLISVVTFADHGFWNRVQAVEPSFTLPDPTVDTPLAATKGKDSAVLAGGCFWGVQEVFLHVKGVKDAISG